MANETGRPQSTFVTVVAVIFAILAVLGVLGAISQLVAIASMGSLLREFGLSPAVAAVPVVSGLYYGLELVVSVQLFRRRAWARRVFLWLRVFGVVMAGVGLLAMVGIVGWTLVEGGRIGAGEALIQLIIVAMVLATAGLQIWIIRRLRRPDVVAEFDAPRA